MTDRDKGIGKEAPAALYFGEVMHARLKPMAHRFNYRVMSLLIDLNRLVVRSAPPLSAGRARAVPRPDNTGLLQVVA